MQNYKVYVVFTILRSFITILEIVAYSCVLVFKKKKLAKTRIRETQNICSRENAHTFDRAATHALLPTFTNKISAAHHTQMSFSHVQRHTYSVCLRTDLLPSRTSSNILIKSNIV